jgi:hypothetical protein
MFEQEKEKSLAGVFSILSFAACTKSPFSLPSILALPAAA